MFQLLLALILVSSLLVRGDCGDNIIDLGEECDGGIDCLVDCTWYSFFSFSFLIRKIPSFSPLLFFFLLSERKEVLHLETPYPPELDENYWSVGDGKLHFAWHQDLVEGRQTEFHFGGSHHPFCTYPSVMYVERSVKNCQEYFEGEENHFFALFFLNFFFQVG